MGLGFPICDMEARACLTWRLLGIPQKLFPPKTGDPHGSNDRPGCCQVSCRQKELRLQPRGVPGLFLTQVHLRTAADSGRGVVLGAGLELHLAGGEGLVLHGHSAVAAQHRDAQRLVPGVRLLIPLVHHHRIEGGDQGHLWVGQMDQR